MENSQVATAFEFCSYCEENICFLHLVAVKGNNSYKNMQKSIILELNQQCAKGL
jgi:hypothetical protein